LEEGSISVVRQQAPKLVDSSAPATLSHWTPQK